MVEAAGVGPASGTDQRGPSTCVATSAALAGRPPRWQRSGRPARTFSPQGLGRAFRLSRCATPIRSPAGERVRWTGCFKQPALTVSWRLVVFHLFYEEWASARCPSLNSPVETVSPPHVRPVVLGRPQNIAPGS